MSAHVVKITYIDRARPHVTYVKQMKHDGGFSLTHDESKARRWPRNAGASLAGLSVETVLKANGKPLPIVSVHEVAQ